MPPPAQLPTQPSPSTDVSERVLTAGEERPCPAPVGLQIMWEHGDVLRVASGCTARSWEPENSQHSFPTALCPRAAESLKA